MAENCTVWPTTGVVPLTATDDTVIAGLGPLVIEADWPPQPISVAANPTATAAFDAGNMRTEATG